MQFDKKYLDSLNPKFLNGPFETISSLDNKPTESFFLKITPTGDIKILKASAINLPHQIDNHTLTDQEKFLIVNNIDLTTAMGRPIITMNKDKVYHAIDAKIVNSKVTFEYLNSLDDELARSMLDKTKPTKYMTSSVEEVLDKEMKKNEELNKTNSNSSVHTKGFNPKRSKGI